MMPVQKTVHTDPRPMSERKTASLREVERLCPAIETLARAHEYRDPYTCRHQRRTADIAVGIAELLGLPRARQLLVRLAANVHDIGKLSIPAEIVNKPGRLSAHEYAIVQTHAEVGREILLHLGSPLQLAEIVHQHHERIDGSGYPRRLEESDILLEARIIAVADVFDAMSSYRPYRPGLPQGLVFAELRQAAGRRLDAEVVEACIRYVLEQDAAYGEPAAGTDSALAGVA